MHLQIPRFVLYEITYLYLLLKENVCAEFTFVSQRVQGTTQSPHPVGFSPGRNLHIKLLKLYFDYNTYFQGYYIKT